MAHSVGVTKSLAKEIGGRGIRVNMIEPGFITTDMTAGNAICVNCNKANIFFHTRVIVVFKQGENTLFVSFS